MSEAEKLIKTAGEARKMSYSPYSHFAVGAALLCADGEIFTGANVENSSYGGTICAERSAFCAAISAGKREFAAIAVVGAKRGEEPAELCPPCGICRQVMRDFANKDEMIVICAKSTDDYIEHTLDEMLPLSFGPEAL